MTTTTPWVKARPVHGQRGVYRSRAARRTRPSAGEITRDVIAATVFFLLVIMFIVSVYLGAAVMFL